MFLEIYPFLLGLPICWHITVHSILLGFFVFWWYWFLFLLFHFLFCWFGSSIFSSWWGWLKTYQFWISFQKNHLLVLLIFSIFFFSFYVIFSLSDPYYSHLFADVGLVVLLFLIPSDDRLGCLFEIFLLSFFSCVCVCFLFICFSNGRWSESFGWTRRLFPGPGYCK